MSRLTQVKKLTDIEQLSAHLASIGADIPVDPHVEPNGPLSDGATFTDSGAGVISIPNRFAILPMEGWDAADNGAPTELVRRRWDRFARSGAGLVWAEATAVVPEGRANPHQLMLTSETVDDIAAMRAEMADGQVVGLQLTHSGRWCRPEGPLVPATAYEHPLLDAAMGAGPGDVMSDGQLDDLVGAFVGVAVLAADAGFDFVDVKACHGYLGHELLTAHDRPGRYGGDLAGRTTFLRSVTEGIRSAKPDLAIALRLSVFDLIPHEAGADGRG